MAALSGLIKVPRQTDGSRVVQLPLISRAPRLTRGFVQAALLSTALLILPACEGDIAIRGNMPDLAELTAVTPGSDSREDVLNLLGTPSSLSTFEQNKWYYIGQKVEQFAFFRPEVIDRQVLVVGFDDNGIVNQTELLSLDDAILIDPVDRVTTTEGVDFTLMEQFFGNFGRLPGAVGGETR